MSFLLTTINIAFHAIYVNKTGVPGCCPQLPEIIHTITTYIKSARLPAYPG
jgi:hypothetical protein